MYYYDGSGFRLEPVTNSVEISNDYYNLLMEGQSNGKVIVSDSGYPILADFQPNVIDINNIWIIQLEAEAQTLMPYMVAGIDVEINQQKLIDIILELEDLKGNLE